LFFLPRSKNFDKTFLTKVALRLTVHVITHFLGTAGWRWKSRMTNKTLLIQTF